jgi:hypothetical protein
MWSRVVWYIAADDSEQRAAYIFKKEEWEILYPEDGGNIFLCKLR